MSRSFVWFANLHFKTHVLKYGHCLTSTHPIYHFLKGKALFTFHNILEDFLTHRKERLRNGRMEEKNHGIVRRIEHGRAALHYLEVHKKHTIKDIVNQNPKTFIRLGIFFL